MTTTPRTVVPTLFPPPGYAHAALVEAGTTLAFMAGSVPLDPEGNLVGEGDVVRQTEQVIANLDEALRAIGSDLTQVVASTVYVVSGEPGPLSEAWGVIRASDLLAKGPHTSTLLGTTCLGYPGQLVEITATAVVPETSTAPVSQRPIPAPGSRAPARTPATTPPPSARPGTSRRTRRGA